MEKAVNSISLATLSPRDDKLRVNKLLNETIAQLYDETQYEAYSVRMSSCSLYLCFRQWSNHETGEVKLKLKQLFLCKVRHCPCCSYARSRVWKARLHEGIPKFVTDYPTARFIFLTLTVRNCDITELNSTLKGMSKAFDKLMKRRGLKPYILGYIRSMEVTRNPLTGDAHPHYHVILAVKPNYFSRGYVPQSQWVNYWQESLNVSYTPVLDVKVVKPNPNLVNDPLGLASSIMELCKYCVKHTDMSQDRDWLVELTTQLHGTKHIVLGGLIKQYVNASDPNEQDILKGDNDDDDLDHDDDPVEIFFSWFRKKGNYFLSNR